MSDLKAKAEEVQEAAAEAALAENDGGVTIRGVNIDLNGDPWPEEPMDDSAIAGIPEAFAYIADIDYSGLPEKQAAVERGASMLDEAQGQFGRLKALLNDEDKFKGSTVNTFYDYLDIIADVAEDQGQLAMELATGVRTQYSIRKSAEEDAMQIAEATIDACNRIKDENEADDVKMAFMGLSIALAITTAAFTGGMSFALMGAGLTAAQGAYEIAGPATDAEGLGGSKLDTVLNGDQGMYSLLKDLEDKMYESVDAVADGLWKDVAQLNGKGEHDKLDNLNPNPGGLVDGPGNFRATEAVQADLKELYNLATGNGASSDAKSNVPQLAKDLSVATKDFNDANGTEELAMGTASGPWELVLDKLQKLTAKASTALYDGGTVLGKAAQSFAEQDGYNASWIDKSTKEVIDREDPTEPLPEQPDYYTIEEGPYKGKQIPLD
ncbi:MAG TPA: hypothetical protein H9902_09570 [Candidatus Stackebrandtia faecavium]|nr:hypothetical protein [Candidatus Stackebrandtia faecavium]